MRLIDADVLKEHFLNGGEDYYSGYAFHHAIDHIPTIDAVPVVRCKDCQYSREPNRHDRGENAACEGVLICCVGFDHVYPSAYDGLIFVDKNGYCFHGERKGGDE